MLLLTSWLPHLGEFTASVKLPIILPVLVDMCKDSSSLVRAGAIRAVAVLLKSVRRLPRSETFLFRDYLLPGVGVLASDPEVHVRVAFAQSVSSLAESAERFSTTAQAQGSLDALKTMERRRARAAAAAAAAEAAAAPPPSESSSDAAAAGSGDAVKSGAGGGVKGNLAAAYNEEEEAAEAEEEARVVCDLWQWDNLVAVLREDFERVLQDMFEDSSSQVKRALLSDSEKLCLFFGRQKTSDFFLPHMCTVLNTGDWELRAAFFENVVGVCTYVGPVAVDQYILPFILQKYTGE